MTEDSRLPGAASSLRRWRFRRRGSTGVRESPDLAFVVRPGGKYPEGYKRDLFGAFGREATMFSLECNVDGTPYDLEYPAEPKDLNHAAAIVVAHIGPPDENWPFGLDSQINLRLPDFPSGTGMRTVREAIGWALSEEGRTTLEADDPASVASIERTADALGFTA